MTEAVAALIPFPAGAARRRSWSALDFGELYRLVDVLARQGLPVALDVGQSDEGDPWATVYREDSGDVLVHVARIDGQIVLSSVAESSIRRGRDLRAVIEAAFAGRLNGMLVGGDTTRLALHPSAVFLALVVTAWMSTEAKAERGGQELTSLPGSPVLARGEESPSQQPNRLFAPDSSDPRSPKPFSADPFSQLALLSKAAAVLAAAIGILEAMDNLIRDRAEMIALSEVIAPASVCDETVEDTATGPGCDWIVGDGAPLLGDGGEPSAPQIVTTTSVLAASRPVSVVGERGANGSESSSQGRTKAEGERGDAPEHIRLALVTLDGAPPLPGDEPDPASRSASVTLGPDVLPVVAWSDEVAPESIAAGMHTASPSRDGPSLSAGATPVRMADVGRTSGGEVQQSVLSPSLAPVAETPHLKTSEALPVSVPAHGGETEILASARMILGLPQQPTGSVNTKQTALPTVSEAVGSEDGHLYKAVAQRPSQDDLPNSAPVVDVDTRGGSHAPSRLDPALLLNQYAWSAPPILVLSLFQAHSLLDRTFSFDDFAPKRIIIFDGDWVPVKSFALTKEVLMIEDSLLAPQGKFESLSAPFRLQLDHDSYLYILGVVSIEHQDTSPPSMASLLI